MIKLDQTQKQINMRYIICLLLMVVLSNCELTVKKVGAQEETSKYDNKTQYDGTFHTMKPYGCYSEVVHSYVKFRGMDYVVISGNSGHGGTAPTVAIINLTKDELEVELLKRKLKDLAK